MPTQLHFSESDKIEVTEDFDEVVKQFRGGGWVELHELTADENAPVAVSVAAVRRLTPYEHPEPFVA